MDAQLKKELDRVFREDQSKLIRFIKAKIQRLTADEVADIIQDAYLTILDNDEVQIKSVQAYLFKIAEHLAINASLKRSRRGRLISIYLPERTVDEMTPQRIMEYNQQLTKITEMLKTMPLLSQNMIYLIFNQELTVYEAAEKLNVHHRKARRALLAAMKKIQTRLK